MSYKKPETLLLKAEHKCALCTNALIPRAQRQEFEKSLVICEGGLFANFNECAEGAGICRNLPLEQKCR